jgi:putative PEP-CTERM system TPR-repeat lipoprotein
MTILTWMRANATRVAVAGLAAALLVACGQDSPEKLLASAKAYLAKGDSNAAKIQLRNLLNVAPDNGEARLLLGEALLQAEDYVAAEKELGRAIELKQPQERAVPLYVLSLLRQGKSKEVVAAVEKYKLFDPQAVAVTQTALGDAQLQLGNAAGAKAAFSAALAAVPGYARAKLGEAQVLLSEGQADDALKLADEIIAAEPKLAEARAFRAALLLRKGDRAGGKKGLEEAIAADERFLPARLALIEVLIGEQDFDGAAKAVDAARKRAPGDLQLTFFDALLTERKGDLAGARQKVQQVLKFLPDYVPALILAGSIELKERQLAAAESTLSKAVARAPNHLGARALLIRTHLAAGQPLKAKEVLQPIVDRGVPASPALQLLAGETFLANGDVGRAEAFFKMATKAEGAQQAAARTRLGQIALATGRSQEGFSELETASELDTGAIQADLALIAGHLQRKEHGKALEAVKALEKKQPNNPLTFQMYALVHLAKGDQEAARASLGRALQLQPNYLPAARILAQLDVAAKKPDDARKRYEAMIAAEPKNEQIHLALAEFQAQTGASPKEIAATLGRAVAANPQNSAARIALMTLLIRTGETKAALAAAQDALAVLSSDAAVLEVAGQVQEAAGETNQAIRTYGQWASLQPQSLQPLYRLAALYLRQNDAVMALETLRKAQKIAPAERHVVMQLAQVYLSAGRYDEALKEARDLQKRDPTSADGFALEGDIYLSQRDYVQAERKYREALKLQPKATAVAIKVYVALLEAGKRAEADAWAKQWVADHPKDAAMRAYLGQRELTARNLKAAAAHFSAAVAIEPTNAVALNNLAWVSGELGDPKALGYAERALKLAPNSAAILDTYGMLLVKKGEVDKGLPYLERARQAAPGRHDLRLNYAKALIKAGRKDDARKELEALQGVKDDFPGKGEVAGLLKGL